LPPYSHDFNPIEPVRGLVKKRIRDYAPAPATPRAPAGRARRAPRGEAVPCVASISPTPGTVTQLGTEILSLGYSRTPTGESGEVLPVHVERVTSTWSDQGH
jgi:transposase